MNYIVSVLLLFSVSCSHLGSNDYKTSAFNWDRDFIPIMQGATSETSSIINFIIPKSFEYTINAKNLETDNKINFSSRIKTIKSSYWNIIELHFNHLKLEQKYSLSITISRNSFSYTDRREFRSFNTKKSDYKLSIASCMADTYPDIAEQAWSNIQKNDVDAFVIIGDAVYADFHNSRYTGQNIKKSQEIWSRHIDARNSLPLYRIKKLKPVFAIWDDHDLGTNNGNKYYKYLKQSKKYFRDFFPLKESSRLVLGKGIGFLLKLGNHNLYLLDNRSFRDKKDLKTGEHLGKTQTKWLLQNIKRGQGINWLIQGDQFFGGYHPFESFEGDHPEKFKQLLAELKKIGKKYIFISGDRHLYELMEIDKKYVGHKTYEVTTSGIHATLFPGSGSKIKNNKRLKIIDNAYTSLLLELHHSSARYKVLDHKGNILDQQKINLKEGHQL